MLNALFREKCKSLETAANADASGVGRDADDAGASGGSGGLVFNLHVRPSVRPLLTDLGDEGKLVPPATRRPVVLPVVPSALWCRGALCCATCGGALWCRATGGGAQIDDW